MKFITFGYSLESGWSVEDFPDLDSAQTLVLIFGHTRYHDDNAPIQELRRAYGRSKILGCSTSGEILGTSLRDESLSVAVVRFEHTILRQACVSLTPDLDSHDIGRQLAQDLHAEDLRAVFVLSNGLEVNGTRLVDGMNTLLSNDVIVTGGLAGDGPDFNATWVTFGDTPDWHQTAAIGFYGDRVQVTHGSRGGWDRFGIEREVTRSDNNVLYELAGKPALDLYKQYLGEHASDLPSSALLFPLEVFNPEDPEKRLVRTILSVDHEQNSMTFAGDIPQGWNAQLMKANFERLLDGAEDATEQTDVDQHTEPPLCIAISCIGRRLVLQSRTEDEIEAVADGLPEGAGLVGFYSYGELSPWNQGQRCELHNQTMTLTLISERT